MKNRIFCLLIGYFVYIKDGHLYHHAEEAFIASSNALYTHTNLKFEKRNEFEEHGRKI